MARKLASSQARELPKAKGSKTASQVDRSAPSYATSAALVRLSRSVLFMRTTINHARNQSRIKTVCDRRGGKDRVFEIILGPRRAQPRM